MILSVVIPVYRSEATLRPLLARLDAVLELHASDSEVILVNDCSPDKSWDVIVELSKTHTRLRGINLMRNYGQHNALLAGIEEARGEIIVTMDDDLQTPPEEMPRLLEELALGYDLVYGTRAREQHGFVRNFCSTGIKWGLNKILGVGVATSITSYRAFRSQLRNAFNQRSGACVFIDALLCWGTTRISSVVVSHGSREDGKSGYNFFRLLAHTANMVTSFSSAPLRLAGVVGIGTTAIGTLLFIYVIATYFLTGRTVPGFTFLAGAMILFSGVQLFVLGIVGEYLARMHQRLMGTPAFVVRERLEFRPDEGKT